MKVYMTNLSCIQLHGQQRLNSPANSHGRPSNINGQQQMNTPTNCNDSYGLSFIGTCCESHANQWCQHGRKGANEAMMGAG